MGIRLKKIKGTIYVFECPKCRRFELRGINPDYVRHNGTIHLSTCRGR